MSAAIATEFNVPFIDIWQQLGYKSELIAAADLKMSSLVLDVDYIETETETLFTKEGAIKFCLEAKTEAADLIRQRLQDEQLALPPQQHQPTATVEPVPAIDPQIKFWVDRENLTVWGKLDEHYFTVSYTGKATHFYNVPDWTFPDAVVADGQIKPEIVDYTMQLI